MSKETISQTEGLCKEVANCIRNAYDRGYKQGFKDAAKSEYEHDHAVVKAYNDGQVYVLDKIKTDIIEMRSKQNVGVLECLDIIDKYREVSE